MDWQLSQVSHVFMCAAVVRGRGREERVKISYFFRLWFIVTVCMFVHELFAVKVWVTNNSGSPVTFWWKSGGYWPGVLVGGPQIKDGETKWGDDMFGNDICQIEFNGQKVDFCAGRPAKEQGLAQGKQARYWAFGITKSTESGKTLHYKAYQVDYDKVLQAGFKPAAEIAAGLGAFVIAGEGIALIAGGVFDAINAAKDWNDWQDYMTLHSEGDV